MLQARLQAITGRTPNKLGKLLPIKRSRQDAGATKNVKEQMRRALRRLILWACPEIIHIGAFLSQEARFAGDLALRPPTSPGAHASHAMPRAAGKSAGHSVPGAHVWVLAALALGMLGAHTKMYAQQGGQTSSAPAIGHVVTDSGSVSSIADKSGSGTVTTTGGSNFTFNTQGMSSVTLSITESWTGT